MIIDKNIEDIIKEDIQLLIDNAVCESRFLDYKQELHIDTDGDKKEFLADISSFANSAGGDIILGVEEDNTDKIPTSMCGIPYENDDKLIRKIEDLIRQSIQPVILNIQFKVIDIGSNKCILVIRIPQSIISPHRVEYKGTDKFFSRNNKGKYPMDVSELRLAFNSGLDLNRRISEYKMDRYYELLSNRNKVLNDNSPIFVVHYIPISAFNNSLKIISVAEIKKAMNDVNSRILGDICLKNITVDGVCMKYNQFNKKSFAYYKNNGIIEKASSEFFEKDFTYQNRMPKVTIDMIYGLDIITKLIEDFNEVKKFYTQIGINPPLIISCSFLNAINYTIPTDGIFSTTLGTLDRDILCINDLYIEDINDSSENILKPIFDSIWNACGHENCQYYDEDGNFKINN